MEKHRVESLPCILQALLQTGLTNYLIVALDEEVRDYMQAKGLNVYYHKVIAMRLLWISVWFLLEYSA